MKDESIKALRLLRIYRDRLTVQQYRTLKGQVLAGCVSAAITGLFRILGRPRNDDAR